MIDRLADISCIASAIVILVIMFGRGKRAEHLATRSRHFIYMGVAMLMGFSILNMMNHLLPDSVSSIVGRKVAEIVLQRGAGVLAGYLFIIFGLILSVPVAFIDQRTGRLQEDVVHARTELASVNTLMTSLLKSSLSGVMVLDAVRDEHRSIVDFRCRMMNGAAEQILGRSSSTLIGHRLFENVPCLEATSVSKEVQSVIATGLPYNDEWLCESGREPRWYQIAAVKIGDGITVTFADVSDRKQSEEKLKHAALHDALTGLPNRAMFMERLSRAIKCTKHFTDHRFAVLFLDFDRFKVVNDSLGHEVGDQLLLNIAARLRKTLAEIDAPVAAGAEHVPARLGGDEFVVLLDGIRAESNVIKLADRLQEVLAAPHELDGHEVVSTASIGVVFSDGRYNRADDIIRDADAAMYRAKTSGKAQNVVFDDGMKQAAVNRLELERELRVAVDNMDFELQYEPIVDLSTGRLAGLESLVRWVHPQRGLIPASEFLGVAEELGLLVPIGRWGLQQACTAVRDWSRSFPQAAPFALHVNLSRQELTRPGMAKAVRQVLKQTGLDPALLRLELDERMLDEHLEDLATSLAALEDLGVGLVLDDFGAGPSSLRLLNRVRTKLIKLDRSFLLDVAADAKNLAIIRSVIDLAHGLGRTVVAKSIETREQMQMLQSVKCDLGQGHYFREPLGRADIESLLGEGEPFSLAA